MNTKELRIKDFPSCNEPWSQTLWKKAKDVYAISDHLGEELYAEEIQKHFLIPFHSSVLHNITSPFVKEMLTAELYQGKKKTLLEKISDEIHRHHIEGKGHVALVTVAHKHLKKFKLLLVEFMNHLNAAFESFKDFMEIGWIPNNENNCTILTFWFK